MFIIEQKLYFLARLILNNDKEFVSGQSEFYSEKNPDQNFLMSIGIS